MPVAPYAPRHAAVPVGVPATIRSTSPDTEIKAPGIAALLHRRRHQMRLAAIGALGIGVALFVATSVASAATSHSARTPAAAAPKPYDAVPPRPALQAPAVEVPDVTVAQPVQPKPAKRAPASAKVISGLAANGIPNVALNAYRVAALRMENAQPSCGIDWALLAGIGREESDHGQFHGAVLHPNGTSTPRIVGPALDGAHGQYIAAPPDGLALDGDSVYTHALGPMQFIPQTWASYGVDANGDGKKDVFNINDAALGAARYLCAAGGNLRTVTGQIRAVRAYNHDDTYVAQVLALAAAYRAGVPITGLPVGLLTGALPPLLPGGTLGVNPGLPTAAGTALSGSHRTAPHGASSSTAGSHPSPRSGSRPPAGSSSAPSTPSSGPSSSAPPSSSPSPPSGASSTPPPSPSPSPTCRVGLGGVCVLG